MPQKTKKSIHWPKKTLFSIFTFIVLVFVIAIIPEKHVSDGFKTISDVHAFCQTLDESVPMDNKNYFFPSFESYYLAHFSPSLYKNTQRKIANVLASLRLKKDPIFSESFFKSILEKTTNQRRNFGWVGNFVQKIECTPTSKIVVFGPVQGALHSMDRYLAKLHELNILNEDLTISKPDYFIIFLGNAIIRSPYSLETFGLVLKLMNQNPQNVIYLHGTNEFPSYWRDHTLRRLLELRAHHLSQSDIPLENEVDAFFNTLPQEVFCTMPFLGGEKLAYFKAYPYIEEQTILEKLIDSYYIPLLGTRSTPDKPIASMQLLSVPPDPNALKTAVELKAGICDIKKRTSFEPMDGIRLLPPTQGTITWNVLSCPTPAYQKVCKFSHDAFVIIEPQSSQKDVTITLYNRDVSNPNNKFMQRSYDFLSGERIKDASPSKN